ncbi:MAG: alpha/beta hydrolase, partial [Caldilinea sp.]
MQDQPANCDFKGDVTQLSWPLQMFVATMKMLDAIAPQAVTNLMLAKFVSPRRKQNSDYTAELPTGAQHIEVVHNLMKLTGWMWENSGPAVLVVHGWESHTGRMAPLIEALLNRGYRVFAMDAPGHGLSPAVKTDLLDVSYALQSMMEQYGPFYGVISHSFGAAATTIMLARAPQWMPHKLVLLSPMSDLAQHIEVFARIADLSPDGRERLQNKVAGHVGVSLAQCSAVDAVRTFQVPGLLIH